MQPWRFIRIRDRRLRERIHALVEQERLKTARLWASARTSSCASRSRESSSAASCSWPRLAPDRDKHVFGRRTMPEMDLASVACAIQNLWLAARAEGIGMGWVSLFEPEELRELLRMPAGAQPVAVLCLGHVPEFYPRPMLEMTQWTRGCSLESVVHTDYWGSDGAKRGQRRRRAD